jgi:hypothetical protein
MKTGIMTMLILTAIFVGCTKCVTLERGYYESMHFIRNGGGDMEFTLYPTDNTDRVTAIVSRYQFRDTTVQMRIDNSADNAVAFSLLHKAMNNQMVINGDFQQPTAPTGTWAFVYMVANQKETEVTNTDLRNSLLRFEQLVRAKM